MSPAIAVARAVARRTTLASFRSPGGIVPSLVPPLFFLVAFGGGLTGLEAIPSFEFGPGYTSFAYGFAFLQAATLAGVFTGFGVARDFDSGFFRRLLVAAPVRGAIVAGYVLAGLARWAVAALAVTIAALLAGAQVSGGPLDLLGLVMLGVLANVAAALWACGVAMLLRTEQAGALIQLPVFLVLFLAPVYLPVELIGGWVHAVAEINPATAVLEAIRGLIAGSPAKTGLAFGLLVAGVSLLVVWARRGLASAERAAA